MEARPLIMQATFRSPLGVEIIMEEKKQMELQVQADEATLSGRLLTMAQVTHTAEEFWIDFFAVFP